MLLYRNNSVLKSLRQQVYEPMLEAVLVFTRHGKLNTDAQLEKCGYAEKQVVLILRGNPSLDLFMRSLFISCEMTSVSSRYLKT